jgi:hypothetical protein
MAKEHWSKVSEEYTAKSTYIQNDLEQAFLEMHCVKGTDICTFLTTLQYNVETDKGDVPIWKEYFQL